MVLGWAPPGVDGDACAGWDAFQRQRQGESDAFVAVNVALTVAISLVTLAPLAAIVVLRDTPAMQRAGAVLTAIYFVNMFVFMMPVTLKRAIVDPITRQPTMPCFMVGLIYVTVIAVQGSVSLVRVMHLIHQARAAQAMRLLGRIEDVDDTSLNFSRTSDFKSLSFTFWQDLRVTVRIIHQSLFRSARLTLDPGTSRAEDEKLKEIIRLYSQGHSTRALLLAILIFSIPSGIIYVFFALVIIDPFKSPTCKGCDLFGETIIMVFMTYSVTLLIRIRLIYLMGDQPDPDHIVLEIKQSSMVIIVLMAIGIVLLATDPGKIDFTYDFAWEYLLIMGLLIPLYFSFRAIVAGFRQKLALDKRTLMALPSVETSLANPTITARFETFAEQHFCVELIRFVQDATLFGDLFFDRSEKWRQTQARKICDRFIRQGAILQVNIGDDIRCAIEESMDQGGTVSVDLFRDALRDVYMLILTNDQLWKAFVRSGGCREIEPGATYHRSRNLSSAFSSPQSVSKNTPSSLAVTVEL